MGIQIRFIFRAGFPAHFTRGIISFLEISTRQVVVIYLLQIPKSTLQGLALPSHRLQNFSKLVDLFKKLKKLAQWIIKLFFFYNESLSNIDRAISTD